MYNLRGWFLIFLSFFGLFLGKIRACPVISELFADPQNLSDRDGEFLELYLPGTDSVLIDSIIILAGDDSIQYRNSWLEPGSSFVLCADSVIATSYGYHCDRQWQGRGFVNGDSLSLAISCYGNTENFIVPPSVTGMSWENTLDAGLDYKSFRLSEHQFATGDNATPGFRNSVSVISAEFDWTIASLDWNHSLGELHIVIENTGTTARASELFVSVDDDWDGIMDRQIHNVGLSPNRQQVSLPVTDKNVWIEIRLARDDSPVGDIRIVPAFEKSPVIITEFCAAPSEGRPEWFEVQNRSGQIISLNQLSNSSRILGPESKPVFLSPLEHAIVTEDSSGFRNQFGDLPVNLIQPQSWSGLRNSGDTLRLNFGGFGNIDSVMYSSSDLKESGCMVLKDQSWTSKPAPESTPGFEVSNTKSFSWKLLNRIVDVSKPGEGIKIRVNGPADETFQMIVFESGGREVKKLCNDCIPPKDLIWHGKDERANNVPIGAYIIAVKKSGGTVEKKSVVVARPL